MRLPRLAFCLALLVLWSDPLKAELATLVKDLAPGDNAPPRSTSPVALFPARDHLFFLSTVDQRPALSVTDGTAGGTQQLLEPCSGACGEDIAFVAALGRVALFADAVEASSDRLWRSDGTRVGTYLLADGLRLVRSTFTVHGRWSYFLAFADEAGAPTEQLWRTDGSRAGTTLVVSLGAGVPVDQVALVAAEERMFFLGPQPAGHAPGSRLWVSDGSAAGTRPLPSSGTPYRLTAVGSRVFFFVASPAPANELWVSDGSSAGTSRVIGFGVDRSIHPDSFVGGQARLYFQADDSLRRNQLWASDGTRAGTVPLTSFPEFADYAGPVEIGSRLVLGVTLARQSPSLYGMSFGGGAPERLCPRSCGAGEFATVTKVAGRALFEVGGEWQGVELWGTDGTATGTEHLKQICPGAPRGHQHGQCYDAGAIRVLGSRSFFEVGSDNGLGGRLWVTDGTSAGTRRFSNRRTQFPEVTSLAGAIAFTAVPDDRDLNDGRELFVGDGTPAGERQLTDTIVAASSSPQSLRNLGNRVLFQAGLGGSLYASDGTAAGTRQLNDVLVSSPAFASAGLMYFISTQDHDRIQLWASDGTPEGTRQVTHFETVLGSIGAPPVPAPGGVVFVVGWLGDPSSIWRSDGTENGTVKMFDLPAEFSAYSPQPNQLAVFGSEIYLTFELDDGGQQIWHSDGTTAGTVRIAESCCAPPFSLNPEDRDPQFRRVGQATYFIEFADGRRFLRQTDGTAAGTRRVTIGDAEVVNPSDLVAVGSGLYFFADSTLADRRSLWRLDGVTSEARLLGSFMTGDAPRSPHGIVPFAAGVAFVADDRVHGLEPWVSDGSAGGTRLLADVFPGSQGSTPADLISAGGRLFFSADDSVHGSELWESAGTSATTRLVQDIAPGPESSNPARMTEAGGRLFFAADDGLTGEELWALHLDSDVPCRASSTALCLDGGRFRAEVLWTDDDGNGHPASGTALTSTSGVFSFSSPESPEVAVKVLDGDSLNGHAWVFYGGLTARQFALTVTDSETGVARRYLNPRGEVTSYGDAHAFGPLGAEPAVVGARATAGTAVSETRANASGSPCQVGPTRLCLLDGRFAVDVAWGDGQGQSGAGQAVTLADVAGYFWFASPESVEWVMKIVDGRAVNGKFWFFSGGLTNLAYTIAVTDTATGRIRVYRHAQGDFASVADVAAF